MSRKKDACRICNGRKQRNQVVCDTCWSALPKAHTDALLNAHFSGDHAFELATNDARNWINSQQEGCARWTDRD